MIVAKLTQLLQMEVEAAMSMSLSCLTYGCGISDAASRAKPSLGDLTVKQISTRKVSAGDAQKRRGVATR